MLNFSRLSFALGSFLTFVLIVLSGSSNGRFSILSLLNNQDQASVNKCLDTQSPNCRINEESQWEVLGAIQSDVEDQGDSIGGIITDISNLSDTVIQVRAEITGLEEEVDMAFLCCTDINADWLEFDVMDNSIFYNVGAKSKIRVKSTGQLTYVTYDIVINNLNTSLDKIEFDLPLNISPQVFFATSTQGFFNGVRSDIALEIDSAQQCMQFRRHDNIKFSGGGGQIRMVDHFFFDPA